MSSNSWNPTMSYTKHKSRSQNHSPNLLEQYTDASVTTFWRYTRAKPANYKFDLDADIAIRMSNAIDLVDSQPQAMDQVIWGVTHPDDVHPGVQFIVDYPQLVDLLLIRHFKAHGGITLPNLAPALALQRAHEIVAGQEKAQGTAWGNRTMMSYPNWRDSRAQAPPAGFAAPTAPGVGRGQQPSRGARGALGAGRARGGLGGGN